MLPASVSTWVKLLLSLTLLLAYDARNLALAEAPEAQPLFGAGVAIVTGFSGVLDRSGADTQSVAKDTGQLLIDADGASVRAFDLRTLGGETTNGPTAATESTAITARQVGQVFGIAVDDAGVAGSGASMPNVYVTATSAYGLYLVGTGPTGTPQRITSGATHARWMDGLFGSGGGPGSIWKIDGRTGGVALFADIGHDGKPNSGPGLGNIVYDRRTRQFYVSDLDTGLIHRLNADGRKLDVFDHGTTGRQAGGLEAVPLGPDARADVASPAFKTTDPSTWGFADPHRRVWGLAIRQQRLYYAIADGPQVWSVQLRDDGSYDAGSARLEITLPDDIAPFEIASITFTDNGDMILAQRPPVSGASDFAQLIETGPSRLLRYRAEAPSEADSETRWWPAPAEYSVGVGSEFRNATGGVALGFGYDAAGALDLTACRETVWATGDALPAQPPGSPNVGQATAYLASGIQGIGIGALRLDGLPPTNAIVIDFDGQFPDRAQTGHVGNIAIAGPCPSEVAAVAPGAAPSTATAAAPGAAPAEAPGAMTPAMPDGSTPAAPGPAPQTTQQPAGSGEIIGPTATPPAPPGQPTGLGEIVGPTTSPLAPGLPTGLGEIIGPGYDLSILKAPPHAAQAATAGTAALHVCAAQQSCPFSVTITNIGGGKFTGPFRFKDIAPAGWSYASSSIGWSCSPTGSSNLACTHTLALDPGKSVTLELSLNPMAGVPLQPVQLENCVEIDWSYTKKGGSKGATRSCTPVMFAPTAPAPPSAGVPIQVGGPDLRVRKQGAKTCQPGGECDFVIVIEGAQDKPFIESFEVTDVPPKGWAFTGGGKLGLWTCSTDKDGNTACRYDIKKNPQMPAGGLTTADSVGFGIQFDVPTNQPLGMIKNCVIVSFHPPATGEIRRESKVVCAEVEIANQPKLTISKHFDKVVCLPGEQCDFSITIKNEGEGPYTGLLTAWDVSDPPDNLTVESASGKDWNCSTKFLTAAAHFICYKHALAAGEAVTIAVKAKLAKDVPVPSIQNCGHLNLNMPDLSNLSYESRVFLVRAFLELKGYKISGGDAPLTDAEKKALSDYKTKNPIFTDADSNPDTSGEITDQVLTSLLPRVADASGKKMIEACAKVTVKKPGLQIKKNHYMVAGVNQPQCVVGDVCGWLIVIAGNDERPYTMPVKIEEQLPPGFQLVDYKPKGTGGWTCSGTNKITCTHPPANLKKPVPPTSPGDLLDLHIFARFSCQPGQTNCPQFAGKFPEIKNCAKVIYDDPQQYQLEPPTPSGGYWEACDKQRIAFGDLSTAGFDATGSGPCYPPSCSFYDFTVTQRQNIYRGPLTLRIAPPAGSAFPEARITKSVPACPASSWTCVKSGPGSGGFICNVATCTLAPNEEIAVRIDGKVAPDLTQPPPQTLEKTACGDLEWQVAPSTVDIEQRGTKRSKHACATIVVLAKPPATSDLQISTAPQGHCTTGQSCAVVNTLANVGGKTFSTPLNFQLVGHVEPPLTIRNLRADQSGWSCRTTGGGSYHCIRQPAAFGAQALERVSFDMAIPRNLRAQQISNSVQIVWPDAGDGNPANDNARFTIPIAAPPSVTRPAVRPPQTVLTPPQPRPPTITCLGGSILRGTQSCVCPRGKVAVQTAPYRFRCSCPRGSVEVRGRCVTCPPNARWDGRRCVSTTRPVGGATPPASPVVCSGGAVLRGICICPVGTIRQVSGRNAFRCVKVKFQQIPGKIVCRPGTRFINGKCVRVVR